MPATWCPLCGRYSLNFTLLTSDILTSSHFPALTPIWDSNLRAIYLYPQLDRGLLSVMVTRDSGNAAYLLLDQVTVNDGRWHDVRLELQEEPGGRRGHHVFMVSLDFSLFQV